MILGIINNISLFDYALYILLYLPAFGYICRVFFLICAINFAKIHSLDPRKTVLFIIMLTQWSWLDLYFLFSH